MKLLKNKKFWAISLGSIIVSTSIIATATACTNSNIESTVSSSFVRTQNGVYAIYEITNWTKLDDNQKKSLQNLNFKTSVIDKDNNAEFTSSTGILRDGRVYVKLAREPKKDDRVIIKPDDANLKKGAVYVTTLNISNIELNDGPKVQISHSNEKKWNKII